MNTERLTVMFHSRTVGRVSLTPDNRLCAFEPVLDYTNLLALTGYITQNKGDVEDMFRRMVFNYIADNKDDHCKNFSFIVIRDDKGEWSWRLAPAYDLTHSAEGYNGEHATSVNSTSRPTYEDFLAVGIKAKISPARCRELYEQVRENLVNYSTFESNFF